MGYLENYEVKKSTKVLMITLVAFLGIMNLFFVNHNKQMKLAYIEGQQRMVGAIVSNKPELETQVVTAVLGKNSRENKELGKTVLDKYEYNENLNVGLFYDSIGVDRSIFKLNLIIVLFGCLFVIFNYSSHKRIYKKIMKIENWARALIDKKTDFRISEIDDGEISKLFMSFNKVNTIISESLDNVKKEKDFLINLLSDISHQLKTPLSSMILNNEILLSKELQREKELMFLESNEKQLTRMKGLIDNLLKLAKLDAGAITFHSEMLSLTNTTMNAIESLSEISQKYGVNIVFKNNDNSEKIVMHDSFWVQEAIVNIVKNCIEHSNKGELVVVYIKEETVFTRIIVEDSGEGIYSDEIPYIFDRFFKSSRSKKKDSAGIGLNLARTIIESQNGNISAKSEIGKGTSFEISLLR
ncbi:MAG: sensor histidine kinase [Sarcina sp.]